MLFLLVLLNSLVLFSQDAWELNTKNKKIKSFEAGDVSFLIKNAGPVEKFHKNARINPLYLAGGSKIQVEICEDHFPAGSSKRKELLEALNEYEKIPFGKVSWQIENVPHRNADEIISRSINAGTLRIDYADADLYPNDCKEKGRGASWILTQCDYSIISGWKKWGIPLNDGGAILVNEHKYCKKSSKDCENSYPKKQVFLHELGHFFGMAHSDEWPKELRIYSSVMGAFQDYLTAFDMKYMQRYYGDLAEDEKTPENLAVSGRVKGDEGNLRTGTIKDINPKALYLDHFGKLVKDCKTHEAPKFQFGLFNRSGKMFGLKNSFSLEIYLENDLTTYPLFEVPVEKFSPYSEAHFATSIPSHKWPMELFSNQAAKLVFFINLSGEKKFSRHELSLKLKLHADKADCSK